MLNYHCLSPPLIGLSVQEDRPKNVISYLAVVHGVSGALEVVLTATSAIVLSRLLPVTFFNLLLAVSFLGETPRGFLVQAGMDVFIQLNK